MNCYPLIEEVTMPGTPLELFHHLCQEPNCCFLDSGMDPQRLGRYSFIGINPFLVMKSRGRTVTLHHGGEWYETVQANPFDILQKLMNTYKLDYLAAPVPFLGGAIGYLSYDLCHFIERLPTTAVDDLELPESYFAFYDTALAFDNLEGKAFIISTGFPELSNGRRLKRGRLRLENLADRISGALSQGEKSNHIPEQEQSEVSIRSNFTRDEYCKAIEKARDYIIAGDIFQVNVSQRFEAEVNIHPYELYRRLRDINPAPFAGYLNFDEVTVLSASPERFLRVEGNLVETRPIKGTRPRGSNPAEDEKLAQELTGSIKDRAENVMIVDLERNDIGRVCSYGSVEVTELAQLETFPTVFHLTSTVVGELRPGTTHADLLKATFPGGSITGAPKVRAMEIIDELEPTRRSVYTGAIGYLSFGGSIDLNIVIRTMLIKNGKAYFQAGGGIVYDSDPEAEYQETLDKAKALIEALTLAHKVAVETT